MQYQLNKQNPNTDKSNFRDRCCNKDIKIDIYITSVTTIEAMPSRSHNNGQPGQFVILEFCFWFDSIYFD